MFKYGCICIVWFVIVLIYSIVANLALSSSLTPVQTLYVMYVWLYYS